jgi:hypothetical protein
MGNQPSKDNVIDSSYIRRARLGNTKLPDKLHDHSYSQKLERNKKASSNNKYSSRPVVVSPVRHQLVLTNQATPLVSLSAASVTSPVGHPSSLATLSSSSSYQRRSSESRLQDFRSMSSVSLTSEEPDTPTYSSNFARSNPSGKPIDSSYYSDPFMMGHETYVLSSSLPTEDYENGGYVTRNSKSKRDSKEMWVYEYGAEKERDRQTRQVNTFTTIMYHLVYI